jgi:maltoporin
MIKKAILLGGVTFLLSAHAIATVSPEFELGGYVRAGSAASRSEDINLDQYTLGLPMQTFTLGNAADTFALLFFRTHLKFDGGERLTFGYTPSYWHPNGAFDSRGEYYTGQAYAEMTTGSFLPGTRFWVGKRLLRNDVYIVDTYHIDFGGYSPYTNYGAGVFNIPLGSSRFGIHVFRSGQKKNPTVSGKDATRLVVDLSEIPVNQGGKLRTLGAFYHGEFQAGKTGKALTIQHEQERFLSDGLSNVATIQASNGYGALDLSFGPPGALESATGKRAFRVSNALSWQVKRWGGQALVMYTREKDELFGGERKGASLGARLSYDLTGNVKLLTEGATTARRDNNGSMQRLHKITAAVTLGLEPGFWSRPELRFYASRFNWNSSASAAQGFGHRKDATLVGIQFETWWGNSM